MKSHQKITSLLIGSALIASVGIATANAHEGADKAHEKGHHMGHHMFQKMDTNGDGKISADEHATMAAKRFASMDANGDGFVTKEEMKAHWKAMKAKWKKHHKADDK